MKTRGQVIEEYKRAFENKTEGELLLATVKQINALDCSDRVKSIALREEIDNIICAYIEARDSKVVV